MQFSNIGGGAGDYLEKLAFPLEGFRLSVNDRTIARCIHGPDSIWRQRENLSALLTLAWGGVLTLINKPDLNSA